MCRSIKTLRGLDNVSADDVEAAALQFVRKIAGMRKPSRRNEEAFNAAVEEIAAVSERLLERIEAAAVEHSPVAASSGGPAPTLTFAPREARGDLTR